MCGYVILLHPCFTVIDGLLVCAYTLTNFYLNVQVISDRKTVSYFPFPDHKWTHDLTPFLLAARSTPGMLLKQAGQLGNHAYNDNHLDMPLRLTHCNNQTHKHG